MRLAGGDRFIFQWEAMSAENDGSGTTSPLRRATKLAAMVVDSGMQCGVSINPETEIAAIYPLLQTGLVDLVDVLAVNPGFGGQSFQSKTLEKIKTLRKWRDQSGVVFKIMVDGGINRETASAVFFAGADILVAGTFLFKHPQGLAQGVRELLA